MKIKRYLYAFFVLCLMSSCAKEIVDLTGDIKGVVKDANDGHLIENCLVTITPGNASVSTSQAGIFEFVDLEPGEYTLVFKKVGYPEHSQIVSVITGEVKNLDVLMKSKTPFAVSESMIDFADFSSTKEFYVVNNSDGETSFEIGSIPTWLQLSRTKGTVNATSQLAISATIDRNSVDYGEYSQNIVISYKGRSHGEVLLPVKFKKVRLTTPEVECDYEAFDVTQNSFNIKGKLLSTGGSVIYAHGHCWSTHENPTINDSKTDLKERQETGVFASSITGLFVNTTYFVRAYAQNAQGITYSDQVAITTQDTDSDKWDGKPVTSFAGGSGKKFDPYIIKTGGQLLLMNDYDDDYYFRIDGDIDLNNKNWKPIEKFSGTLDGNGHTIYNLRIDRDDISYKGLIGSNKGVVKNLIIRGVVIKGDNSGAIAGSSSGSGQINNCHVTFTESSALSGSAVGGVVGTNSGYIDKCTVNSTNENFAISGNSIGGIAGISGGTITNCFVNMRFDGEDEVGGIVGSASIVHIEGCSYEGQIFGSEKLGGIAGSISDRSDIISCKSDASIEGDDIIGGIAGNTKYKINITACYTEGEIICDNPRATFLTGIAGGYLYYNDYLYCKYSYSTVQCDHREYLPLGYKFAETYYTYSIYDDIEDIVNKYDESYEDEISKYWNLDNCWIWSGTVNGKKKSMRCPRLAWEE